MAAILQGLRLDRAPPRQRLAALTLPVVMITTLLHALGLVDSLAALGHVALVLYIWAEWPQLPTITRFLVGAAVTGAVAVPFLRDNPWPIWQSGFERAAYYATYMTALGFLREAAETSALVRRCGHLVINQPPAKRYLTLTSGTLLFGIILNLGVTNLLGVMITRSNTLQAAGGHEEVRQARQRRMSVALLRGFALTPMASPLSISLAVVLANLTSLRWYDLLPLGIGLAALLMAFGWWLDRRAAPRHLAGLVPQRREQQSFKPFLQFAGLVAAIVGLALAVELLLHAPLTLAILVSAPLISVAWLAVQRKRHGPVKAVRYALTRLGRRSTHMFPSLRAEVTILGSAGFTGVILTALLPPQAIPETLAALHISGPALIVAVLAVLTLAAQIGLNPIVMVTLLASALHTPEPLGVSAQVLGLTFMAGWGLAINASPVTASVLLLARMAGVTPATVGYRWNGMFTLGGFVLLSLVLVGLNVVL